jgi:hypothetical protein
MVAFAKKNRSHHSTSAWHTQFMSLLPAIITSAQVAFRNLNPEARQEAIQEVIANCLIAFCRLVELGQADLAYPTVLARYAVAQYRTGRRVAHAMNIGDVTSPYAQKKGTSGCGGWTATTKMKDFGWKSLLRIRQPPPPT